MEYNCLSTISLCIGIGPKLFPEETLSSDCKYCLCTFLVRNWGVLHWGSSLSSSFFPYEEFYSIQFSSLLERTVLFVNETKKYSFPGFVRDHNLKFTIAWYLLDNWLREVIFVKDGLKEMQPSVLPNNLKSISGLMKTIREMSNWTPRSAQHNCFYLSCALLSWWKILWRPIE